MKSRLNSVGNPFSQAELHGILPTCFHYATEHPIQPNAADGISALGNAEEMHFDDPR